MARRVIFISPVLWKMVGWFSCLCSSFIIRLIMTKILILLSFLSLSCFADTYKQDYATVTEVTIKYGNVKINDVCQQVQIGQTGITTGSVLSTIGGAVVGNQIGMGNGKTIATIVGGVVGSQANNNTQTHTICSPVYEKRPIAWEYVVNYNGSILLDTVSTPIYVGQQVRVVVFQSVRIQK